MRAFGRSSTQCPTLTLKPRPYSPRTRKTPLGLSDVTQDEIEVLQLKAGDFTGLADAYSKYRPGYSDLVVSALIGSLGTPYSQARVADVGAGTGIFTRQLWEKNPASIVAVEPNGDMFEVGSVGAKPNQTWVMGSAESTGLEDSSIELVTMASSFHWPNTQRALSEFDRVLGPEGVFAALWNPRITERSAVEARIDRLLEDEYGVSTRVSSGRSAFANELEETLRESGLFGEVSYMHSLDVKRVATSDYIGAWTSVNDIQSQLGAERFRDFVLKITKILDEVEHVDVHYLTRCWVARKSH